MDQLFERSKNEKERSFGPDQKELKMLAMRLPFDMLALKTEGCTLVEKKDTTANTQSIKFFPQQCDEKGIGDRITTSLECSSKSELSTKKHSCRV